MFRSINQVLLLAVIVVVLVVPTNQIAVKAAGSYCLQFEQDSTMLANPRTGQVRAWPNNKQRHAYWPLFNNPHYTLRPNTITPDGKYYFEITNENVQNGTITDQKLLVEDVAPNTVTVLKHTAAILSAGWAKWGARIAYLWRDHITDTAIHLTIVSADGRLDYGSTILPTTFSIYSNSVDLDWSADGAYLAIVDSETVNLLATNTLQFEQTAIVSTYNSWGWSPTGHHFAVHTEAGWLIGTPDNVHELEAFSGTVAWAPNNRYVAIAHPTQFLTPYDISIFDTANNTSWDIPALDGNLFETEPPITQPMYWSDDSRYLVYPRHRSGEVPQNNDLVAIDSVTQQEFTLVQNLTPYDYATPPVVAAGNGQRFAVRLQDSNKGTVSVVLVNADGTGKTEFVHKGAFIEGLSWSSEGKYVAYVVATTPPVEAIMDGQPTPFPVVGKHDAPFQLVYAKADGSAQHIFGYSQARILFWQGDSVVFIAGTPPGTYTMRRLDPVTGKQTVLADGIPYTQYVDTAYDAWGFWNNYPSPAGDTVLLTASVNFDGVEGARTSTFGAIAALNQADDITGVSIYLARWNGSQYHTLLGNVSGSYLDSALWSPDGMMVAFPLGNGRGIYIYSANGRRVLRQTEATQNLNSTNMVWVPCL